MSPGMGIVGILFTILFILAIIFLITRWFWTWYFKINARLKEQEETNVLLKKIFEEVRTLENIINTDYQSVNTKLEDITRLLRIINKNTHETGSSLEGEEELSRAEKKNIKIILHNILEQPDNFKTAKEIRDYLDDNLPSAREMYSDLFTSLDQCAENERVYGNMKTSAIKIISNYLQEHFE